jgi:hypothetical protein
MNKPKTELLDELIEALKHTLAAERLINKHRNLLPLSLEHHVKELQAAITKESYRLARREREIKKTKEIARSIIKKHDGLFRKLS